MEENKKTSDVAIVSLVMGIISLVASFFCVGLLFGIIGFILSIVGLSNADSKKIVAIWGLITSIVGVLISIGLIILYLTFGFSFIKQNAREETVDEWYENDGPSVITGHDNSYENKMFQLSDGSVLSTYDMYTFEWDRTGNASEGYVMNGDYQSYYGKQAYSILKSNLPASKTIEDVNEALDLKDDDELTDFENMCYIKFDGQKNDAVSGTVAIEESYFGYSDGINYVLYNIDTGKVLSLKCVGTSDGPQTTEESGVL